MIWQSSSEQLGFLHLEIAVSYHRCTRKMWWITFWIILNQQITKLYTVESWLAISELAANLELQANIPGSNGLQENEQIFSAQFAANSAFTKQYFGEPTASKYSIALAGNNTFTALAANNNQTQNKSASM